MSRIRLATRLGAQGGAIVGYLIAFARTASTRMIYGAAFSLIGGLLVEGAVRSATEQQCREVDTALVRVVDDSTTAFLRQAVDLLSEIYAEVFDQLRQSRLVWHDARRAALDHAIISVSLADELDLGRIERFLAPAWERAANCAAVGSG